MTVSVSSKAILILSKSVSNVNAINCVSCVWPDFILQTNTLIMIVEIFHPWSFLQFETKAFFKEQFSFFLSIQRFLWRITNKILAWNFSFLSFLEKRILFCLKVNRQLLLWKILSLEFRKASEETFFKRNRRLEFPS